MTKKYGIVTGASTGIGKAIAIELASENIITLLVGRNKEKLEETKNHIEHTGGKAESIICDLGNTDSVNELITSVKKLTSHIDILVNVAGVWHGENEVYANKDFITFSQQVIVETYMVGLISPTLLVHALTPLMAENSKIINISGTFTSGAKGWLPYFVSKKGIEDLTIGLAEELAGKHIQVNAISPSDTATDAYKEYFPEYIPDAIEPEEIAKQVSYLCSKEGDTITGKVFVMEKEKEPYEGYHT